MNTELLGLVLMIVLLGLVMAGFFLNEPDPIPTPGYVLERTCTTCGESLKLVRYSYQHIHKERWKALFLEHGWVLTDTETFCHKHRVPAPKVVTTPQTTSLTITAPGDANITVNIQGNRS